MHRDVTGLAGVRHKAYDTLGSTNAEALALARDGERGPCWITARSQTAGRGRRGNHWVSEPGNLFATLLLTEPAGMNIAPQLSFVAGLALRDALTESVPALASQTKLKWPNDVLVAGKKVAGILIEGDSGPPTTVVLGFGVNCVSHPSGTAHPASDLAAQGAPVSAETVFAALAQAMAARLMQWSEGEGFARIRADWLAHAAGLGEPIRVRLPARELTGRFSGLDATGRLLLADDSGHVATITAGDVLALGAGASQ
jgi:BirA family biotin operon repressor/biotin-[acetyl-CoA-carboxylase] ligase